jgi:hypothetical protein
MPSFIRPASLIMFWFQGGSQTSWTSASSTPSIVRILLCASCAIAGPIPRPGAVSVFHRCPPVVELVPKGERIGDLVTSSISPSAASVTASATRGEGEVLVSASREEREVSASVLVSGSREGEGSASREEGEVLASAWELEFAWRESQ